MIKVITVLMVLVACSYCEDNEVILEEARAKKKKNAFKLWAMILLFAFSKIAIFKVASFMFFFMIFQKFFYFAGLMLNFFMKQQLGKPSPTPPTMYGPPAEYNTVGYSYGPPEPSNVESVYPGTEYGLPGLTDIGGTFNNWLFNKNA
ncbi:uncharacterized protein LOC126375769 [Pectinophora gossypiella]|uniref:uncharacterized protein LOC126375769 n=1 Tax=Pectinophora gossypiella TaxID=13191 RepID=UPI00214E65C4|nr:uncharacterized protein LOC126375769 [Pectinophora gossypiella]